MVMLAIPPGAPFQKAALPAALAPQVIACLGDSQTQLGSNFGLAFTVPGNGNLGLSVGTSFIFASLICPTGTLTVTWNPVNQTLKAQFPGDAGAGAEVSVTTGGIFHLPSLVANQSVRVDVTYRLLPGVLTSETFTNATRYWRRNQGSWAYAADALTGGKFVWLQNFGIGGNLSSDVNNRIAQIVQSNATIVIDKYGTNDIVAATLLPSQSVAQRAANWDILLAAGKKVFAYLISPRWANEPGGNDSVRYTATKQARITAANKGYIAEAAARPGVTIVSGYANSVINTSTTGTVTAGYTIDGLHEDGGLGYEEAVALAAALNAIYSYGLPIQNTGAGNYFLAVDNVGGNLLTTNQGAFASTGGTVGTGAALTGAWAATTAYTVVEGANGYVINGGNLYKCIVAGTSAGSGGPLTDALITVDGTVTWQYIGTGYSVGFAAGWTVSRSTGSNLICIAHKVTASDGGPPWQELICSGATAITELLRLFPGAPSISNIAAGDLIVSEVDVQIPRGNGCIGFYMDHATTGGLAMLVEAKQLYNIVQGIRPSNAVMRLKLEPYLVGASVTTIQPRLFVGSVIAGTFTIRFRNFDTHKIVAA